MGFGKNSAFLKRLRVCKIYKTKKELQERGMIKTRAVIQKVNWKETTSFIKQCSPTESYFYEDITFCSILYSLALFEFF